MKYKILLTFSLLFLISCQKEQILLNNGGKYVSKVGSRTIKAYKKGSVIIKLNQDFADLVGDELAKGNLKTKSSSLNMALMSMNAKEVKPLFPFNPKFPNRYKSFGLDKWFVIKYDENKAITRADISLEKVEGIEHVEKVRNIVSTAKPVFNDKYYSLLWNYSNKGSFLYDRKKGVDINVVPVWENYTTGKPNVIVAVMDEGVQLGHPDLRLNTLPKTEGGSKNFIEEDAEIDAGEHGTHVAGVIAATNNNGIGVCGIAGGNFLKGESGVKIMSCELLRQVVVEGEEETESAENFAASYVYAADNGAVISQNSWGYALDDFNENGKIDSDDKEYFKRIKIEPSLKVAIDYFIKNAGCDDDGKQLSNSPMKGGLVVFAAGNDSIEAGPPSSYEPIISVAAVDANGRKARFSNYGDFVDICAPGVDIYSTIYGSSYGAMDGTSMACPHVSGVAALVLSYVGGKGFTNDMLKEAILSPANNKIVRASQKIGPLLDALASVSYYDLDLPEQPELTFKWTGKDLLLKWKATGDSKNRAASRYRIFISENKDLLQNINNDSPDVLVVEVEANSKSIGDILKKSIRSLENNKTYYIAVKAYNYIDRTSNKMQVYELHTVKNNPPSVVKELSNIVLDKNSQYLFNIRDYVKDDEWDEFSLKCIYDRNSLNVDIDGDIVKIEALSVGTYSFECLVTDLADNSVKLTCDILVKKQGEEVLVNFSQDKSFLNIKTYTEESEKVKIDIYTGSGSLIYSKEAKLSAFDTYTIYIKDLAIGKYILKLTYPNKTITHMFIKVY